MSKVSDKIETLSYCLNKAIDGQQVGITMTDATEAIWGTSGRGSPNAVRHIEALADLGFVTIHYENKRTRRVLMTERGRAAAIRGAKHMESFNATNA